MGATWACMPPACMSKRAFSFAGWTTPKGPPSRMLRAEDIHLLMIVGRLPCSWRCSGRNIVMHAASLDVQTGLFIRVPDKTQVIAARTVRLLDRLGFYPGWPISSVPEQRCGYESARTDLSLNIVCVWMWTCVCLDVDLGSEEP